jgi:hypothetical protein
MALEFVFALPLIKVLHLSTTFYDVGAGFELNAQTESRYAFIAETGRPYGVQGIGKGREPNGSTRHGDGQSGDWPERG